MAKKSSGRTTGRAAPPGRLLPRIAVLAAAALIVVEAAGYDGRLFAPYYVTRFALLYPLVFVVLALAALQFGPGRRPLRVDLVDCLAGLLGLWLIVAAFASPAPWVAWLGYYNRGTGALFALSVLALFVVARRLFAAPREQRVLVWAAALTLTLAAAVALVQAAGGALFWHVAKPWPGRMTGTTGNPITLAGLSLLAVWLGAWLAVSPSPRPEGEAGEARRWVATRLAAWLGVAAGLIANLLAVTRASYLGALLGVAVLGVVLRRARRRRALLVVIAAVAVLFGSAFVPVPDGHGGSRTLLTRVQDTQASGGGLNENDVKRLELWREALHGFTARPLVGYGPGAFIVADRLYQPSSRRYTALGRNASDPHSLPLLVAVTSGAPGLLLALALAAAVALALGAAAWHDALWWRSAAASEARRDEARRDEARRDDAPLSAGAGAAPLPALAFLVAVGSYLLVSPLDPAFVVPAALVAGAALPLGLGRPLRRVLTVPAVPRRRLATGVAATAATALAVAVVAATVLGIGFYRADLSFATFTKTHEGADAQLAAERFRWEPFYALEAGAQDWRDGKAANDPAMVARGRRFIYDALRLDPTGPLGYADLARLDIAQGSFAAVPIDLRPGLRWNPHDPVLEGLWAYAAFDVLQRHEDAGLAAAVFAAFQATHPASPDGWYWSADYAREKGDQAAMRADLARAQQLAPALTAKDYQQRLLRGR